MQSELTERAKRAWNSIADEFNQWDALGLDEQETYVAITAALVDVPAVERAAWLEDIDSAPYAATVLASYFDHEVGEWIVQLFVAERPSAPFTHWMLVTRPDETSPPLPIEKERTARR